MPKKFLEDMVKAKRARHNPVSEIRPKIKEPKEIKEKEKYIEQERIETFTPEEFEPIYNPPKNKSRFFLWFVAIFSIIFCFFAISFLFAKATVIISPKTQDVKLNENLSATKDSNLNGLSFDLVAIPGQESQTIPATGEKDVSTSATGTVVIFNSFSSASQNLNIATRLQGSNGKIYKTQIKTVVPGMSKGGTPGQIEVGIYGSVDGADYNSSSPLDFTIIGFKGTPKYSKFAVRSKPNTQITGGFVGKAPDVSPADQTTAVSTMKNFLQTDLLQKATAQIPSGFILFKNAVFLNTDDSNISSVENKDGTATLTLQGTLYGIILNEQELTTKIATDNVLKYDGSPVYLPNIKNLVFSLSNPTNASLSDMQNINFTLTGPSTIVWKLDVNKFTNDLLGKSKSNFTQILSQYPNIDSATMTVNPIWKMSVPSQAKDVKVIVNYPQ
jgi:hypothetical protein